MRTFTCLAVAVVLLLLLSQLPLAAQQKTLTILHTNDMHAGYLAHEATWSQSTPKPLVGGFKELAWTIDSLRKSLHTTLLLDAGDVMTGTPISDYRYQNVAGGALIAMMNAIGYDAWTYGNHDLDISQENLRGLIGLAKFPTLDANVADSSGNLPRMTAPSLIITRDSIKIGIIGVMSRDLFQLTNTNNLKGLAVRTPATTIQSLIDSLTPKTDLLIALTHEGVDQDSLLAEATHGLNIIIGGHSHTRLRKPLRINNVIVCQAGANCENLGEITLTVENHTIISANGQLIQLWARHQSAPTVVSALVDEVQQSLEKEFQTAIGTLTVDWKRDGKAESNIGDFIADAIREEGHAGVAVTNSSGIRKDFNAGPIRKNDLFEIMPFRNVLCTFMVSGKELRALVLRHAGDLAAGKSSLQFSGLKVTWKRDGGAAVIVSLQIQGKDVTDDQQILFATSDFVVNQGDKYLGFTPKGVDYTSATVYAALVAKVERDKTINSHIENRFEEIH
jgi:5'-nucleotidase/UDP-sugar diphosphatase